MNQRSIGAIIERLTKDKSFRKDFLNDPVKAIQEMYPDISDEALDSLLCLSDEDYQQLVTIEDTSEENLKTTTRTCCLERLCSPSDGYDIRIS